MFRRDAVLFGRALVPALTVTLCFLILLAFSVPMLTSKTEAPKKPLQISLVHQDGSDLLDGLLHAVTDGDFFGSLLRVDYEDDINRAAGALRAGRCDGVIVLPENFLHDYTTGKNTPALLMTNTSAPAESLAVSQLVPVAEELMELGQGGAFVALGLPGARALPQKMYHELYLDINLTLLRAALSIAAGDPKAEELPLSGTLLPLLPHYFIVFYSFFSLLVSCFFMQLLGRDKKAELLRRLSSLGVTAQQFLLPKLLYLTLYQFCMALFAFLLLHRSFVFSFSAAGWAALAVFSLFETAATVFLFTLLDTKSALLSLVLLGFTGLFCTGGLLPAHYLPDFFSGIGLLLPAGISYRLLALFCGAQLSCGWIFAALLLSCGLFFGAAMLLDRQKKEGF